MIPSKEQLLKQLEKVLEKHVELKRTLYVEFCRRYEVLKLVYKYVKPPARLLEAGAQPFLLSAMLRLTGYDVTALDIEPEQYIDIVSMFNIRVFRLDLERDNIPLPDEYFDIVVFSEVLEHLNPYYLLHTFSELNRVLKIGGVLVLTTPNIASLFRRLKLMLGKNPVYRFHVKEYTLTEVIELVKSYGFEVVEAGYLDVNDMHFLDAKSDNQLTKIPFIEKYTDMVRYVLMCPTRNNLLRLIAYPLVKAKKSLRMLCYVVARKVYFTKRIDAKVKRWG